MRARGLLRLLALFFGHMDMPAEQKVPLFEGPMHCFASDPSLWCNPTTCLWHVASAVTPYAQIEQFIPEGHQRPEGNGALPFFWKSTMNQTNTPNVHQLDAKALICVQLDIKLWSGRQALKREHLVQSNPLLASLPPQDLASMGSVRICDPEEVRVFARIKNEAIRALGEAGLPLLGAIGVPQPEFPAVYRKLCEIGNKFNAKAADLFTKYDANASAWKTKWQNENPSNAHLLARLPSAQQVVGKLRFDFHCYTIESPKDLSAEAGSHFDRQVTGLKGELLAEAAEVGNDMLSRYLIRQDSSSHGGKREHITQKTLRPLKRIVGKLRTFAFVDPSIAPLADVIESVLASLPADGQVDGAGLISVWNLATLLSNPANASKIAAVAQTFGADQAIMDMDAPMTVPSAEPSDASAEVIEAPRTIVQVIPAAQDFGMETQFTGVPTPTVPNAGSFVDPCAFL